MRVTALVPVLMLAACSSDPSADVPPLPKQNAETANQLMRAAEKAAGDAQGRMEQARPPVRSTNQTNEVTP